MENLRFGIFFYFISFGLIFDYVVKFDIGVFGSGIFSFYFDYSFVVMDGILMVIFYVVGVVVLYIGKYGGWLKYGKVFGRMLSV